MDKRIYELHADVCKTLANAKRLEILNALRDKEMTVSELTERVGALKANISQHLAVMRQKGILATRRDGVNIYYRIANPKVILACDIMREVLFEQLKENEKLMKGIQNLK
jgi:ArsR family transcriptional regulator